MLGAEVDFNKDESDLDQSEEEDEEDPFEQFQTEVNDLFNHMLSQKKVGDLQDSEFIKQLIMETRSLKLTYNQGTHNCLETIFKKIMQLVAASTENQQMAKNIVSTMTEYQQMLNEFATTDTNLIEEAEIYCAENESVNNHFHIVL